MQKNMFLIFYTSFTVLNITYSILYSMLMNIQENKYINLKLLANILLWPIILQNNKTGYQV